MTIGRVVNGDDAELAEMAALVRECNAIDARIASILGRPVNPGSIAEWVAACIFNVELGAAANAAAGIDGCFTTEPLAGKTVNVKYKGEDDTMLDMSLSEALDYCLVLTGPRVGAGSSRGTSRPFCIDAAYLFDARQLLAEQRERRVQTGIAASVLRTQWGPAQIYPEATCGVVTLSEKQRHQLQMFGCEP